MMTPQSLTKKITIAANESGVNVLSGELVGQIPFDSAAFITMGLTGSATGLVATINVGQTVAMSMGDVSAENRIPQMDKDGVIFNVPAFPGAIIQLVIANSTAGALTLFINVQETPAQAQVVG